MATTRHIPILLACLATTGVAGAWAQDQSAQAPSTYNPWRTPPRSAPPGGNAEDERGYTQGYLRGFEQGYRRAAEQAAGGAPTANLGPPSSTGSTGSVLSGSVLSDSAPPGIAAPRNPAQPFVPPAAAHDDGQGTRPFNSKSSQWGDYPPLDGGRPAATRPDASAARPPAAAYAPAYPYANPAPQPYNPGAYAQGGYAPGYAQPHQPHAYQAPGYQPYAAPYGYGSPYSGGPSTLGGPFGMSPIPGMPGFGGPGFGAW